jgi:hypothetical protein
MTGFEFEIGWVSGFSDFSNDLPNSVDWVRVNHWKLQSNPSDTSGLGRVDDQIFLYAMNGMTSFFYMK